MTRTIPGLTIPVSTPGTVTVQQAGTVTVQPVGATLPVSIAGSSATVTVAQSGTVNVAAAGAFPVQPAAASQVFRDDFGGSTLDTTKWTLVQTGAGQAVTVTGSELVITTGTTDASETILRSVTSWKADNLRAEFQLRLSQRIANQEFRVRLARADGTAYVEYMFDGTSATAANVQTAQGGKTYSAAAGVNTTASNPPAFAIILDIHRSYALFGYRQLNTLAVISSNAQRDRWIPLPDDDVYVEIRAKNVTGAASTTTFAVDLVHLQHDNPQGVTLEAGTGDPTVTRAVPVYLSSNAASLALGTVQPIAVATSGGTPYRLRSAATTNATSVKASSGRLHSLNMSNANASACFVKLYNKASAPTVGTDTPIATWKIAGGGDRDIHPPYGIQCSAGIAIAITALEADSDTTAVAAGEVYCNITYT